MFKHTHNMLIRVLSGGVLIAVGLICSFSFWVPAYAQDTETEDEEVASSMLDVFGNAHEGIFQLNQESGALSSQLNSLALGFTVDGAAISDASASQTFFDLQAGISGESSRISAASMQNGINASSGLLTVNQSSGIGALQSNQISVAIGEEEGSFASASAVNQTTVPTASQIALVAPINFAPSQIVNIGNGTSGLIAINQESGFASIQRNIIAVASAPNGGAYASARAFGSPTAGSIEDDELPPLELVAPAGHVSISDSFNGALGLVQVSQASGSFNQQSNVLAVAFGGIAIARAVSDDALGDIRSEPAGLPESEAGADAGGTELVDSFAGFNGLAQIAQTSGHNNVTNNALTISVSTLPLTGVGG